MEPNFNCMHLSPPKTFLGELLVRTACWLGRTLAIVGISHPLLPRMHYPQKVLEIDIGMNWEEVFPRRSVGHVPDTGIYLLKENSNVTKVKPQSTNLYKIKPGTIEEINKLVQEALFEDQSIRMLMERNNNIKEDIIKNVAGSLIRNLQSLGYEESSSNIVELAKSEINTDNRERYSTQVLRLIRFSHRAIASNKYHGTTQFVVTSASH